MYVLKKSSKTDQKLYVHFSKYNHAKGIDSFKGLKGFIIWISKSWMNKQEREILSTLRSLQWIPKWKKSQLESMES